MSTGYTNLTELIGRTSVLELTGHPGVGAILILRNAKNGEK